MSFDFTEVAWVGDSLWRKDEIVLPPHDQSRWCGSEQEVEERRTSCGLSFSYFLSHFLLLLLEEGPDYRPRSLSPGWSKGRGREESQRNRRSDSLIGRSLIEACR